MGDADILRRDVSALPIEQVTGVLDALDDDLTYLHDTVHVLEQRTFRALSVQIRGYTMFRRFFLAMNFVMLPVIIAIGLCYSFKEMSIDEQFQPFLQSAIVILLYITGGLGVPLYLGTLWAIYTFSVDQIIPDDISSIFLDDDRSSTQSFISQSEDNDNEVFISELDDDQFIMLSADQAITPQRESGVQTKTQAVENNSFSGISTPDGTEILQSEDDSEERPISSRVDPESDIPGTDHPRQKTIHTFDVTESSYGCIREA